MTTPRYSTDLQRRVRLRVMGMLILLVGTACSASGRAPTVAVLFADGETRQVDVNDQIVDMEVAPWPTYFATLQDMFDESEVVVTGTVVAVELDGILFPDVAVGLDDTPRSAVYTVAVEEAFKGDPHPKIPATRISFVRAGDELRPVLLNGVPPNQVGDQVLWFLKVDADSAVFTEVSMSGLLRIEDGVITTDLYGDVQIAHRLVGRSTTDVFKELRELSQDS
jgi:hypothetical protein